MKKFLILSFSMLLSTSFFAQKSIDQMSFGTDSTLDIMTWNVEQFAKKGQTTLSYVEQIITALDPDIVVFQEIDSFYIFNQLLSDLTDYDGEYNNTSYGSQALAYIYKKNLVHKNSIFPIYTDYYYNDPFPRRPLVFDFNFMGENFILIDNHLKAKSDAESVSRRIDAVNLLKTYIEGYYPKRNVIVLGDMNDELTDAESNNIFNPFLNVPQDYKFADMPIAEGSSSNWSYPSYPSHIDHTMITNELFDEFANAGSVIKVIKVDTYLPGGLSEYDHNVSDHRPEAIRLLPNLNVAIDENSANNSVFNNYPNPCSVSTTFNFSSLNQDRKLEIYNISGKKIISQKINKGQKSVSISTKNLSNGVYFVRLLSVNKQIADLKFVVNK